MYVLPAVLAYSLLLAAYFWPPIAFFRSRKLSRKQKFIWTGIWVLALIAGNVTGVVLAKYWIGTEQQQLTAELMDRMSVVMNLPLVFGWIPYVVFLVRTWNRPNAVAESR